MVQDQTDPTTYHALIDALNSVIAANKSNSVKQATIIEAIKEMGLHWGFVNQAIQAE